MRIDAFPTTRTALLVILMTLVTAPSWGLPMSGPLVYSENYDLESTFPLTPEVDTIGAGGGTTFFAAGNGASSATLGSGHASVALAAAPGPAPAESLGVGFGSSSVGAADFGVRGVFDDFSSNAIGMSVASASVVALYSGVTISSTFFDARINPGNFVGFRVFEINQSTGEQFTGDPIFLSAVDAASVSAGGSFRLDLVIDRGAATATGEMIVSGGGTYTVAPLALTLISGGLISAGQVATLDNNINYGLDDSMSVRFDSFEAFLPIPEPSSALLIALGLAAMGRRRMRQL